MARRKVFVSYKYADDNVYPLPDQPPNRCVPQNQPPLQYRGPSFSEPTKVRDYVDYLQERLEKKDGCIFKGERTDEDMSGYSREYIWEELKNEIYDSSVTLVLISPRMKDSWNESLQWMYKEIEYSLREQPRDGRVSHSNAVLAVILPNMWGRYNYCHETDLFEPLKEVIREGRAEVVWWGIFIKDPKKYIERAIEKKDGDGV